MSPRTNPPWYTTIPSWIIVILLVVVTGVVIFSIATNREVDFWPPKIHARAVGTPCPGPSPDIVQKKNSLVVLVDTRAPGHIYDSNTISNARFLETQIKSLVKGVEVKVEEVMDTIPQASDVLTLNPQLVVIHRSAFEIKKDTQGSEARLKSFLTALRGSNALFLIYSRKPNTDGEFASSLANASGLKGRVYPYQFQTGNPFAKVPAVEHFMQTIQLMVDASNSTLSK